MIGDQVDDVSRQPEADKTDDGNKQDFRDSNILYICILPWNICVVHFDGPVNFPIPENNDRIRQKRNKYQSW